MHEGDMSAQVMQALDNLETVLSEAGFSLADVVRLNYYVTDVDAFLQAGEVYGPRLGQAGCRSAGTLLGVSRLAFPELLVEIEATAAQ
jgi:enamine deaminase RidA (YjgF/YER057c/UK114 family)